MRTITESTLKEVLEQIEQLLETAQEKLDYAYKQSSNGVSISLAVKIKPDTGVNKVKSAIAFDIAEKFKLDLEGEAEETQMSIGFEVVDPETGEIKE